MASEISITQRLTATKGSISRTRTRTFNADWATADYTGQVQNIATSAAGTALSLSGIAAGGWAYFTNLDATNYVEIGVQVAGTFYPVATILKGESAQFRISALTLYARANTAAVDLEYEALNP